MMSTALSSMASSAEMDAGAAATPSIESVCEEICRLLEESEDMAEEAWEREMETVLGRIRTVESAVFSVVVVPHALGRQRLRWRLIHFAALFGSRAVLEEGCNRAPGGAAEAAQVADSEGNMLLHRAVQNKRLSEADIQWVVSLHAAAARTPNDAGNLPLHMLAIAHKSLTPELVDAVLEAHPPAPRSANQTCTPPLHNACCNPHMTATALRHLVHVHPTAASRPNQRGECPLHVLLRTHESLTPELVDVLVEAHPQALRTTSLQNQLPLHCACSNPRMTEPALCHLVRLHPAAACAGDEQCSLPLHLMVSNIRVPLTLAFVDIVLEAHPQALWSVAYQERFPLHCACTNSQMTAPVLRHLLSSFPAAAGTPDQHGAYPLHLLVRNSQSLTPALLDLVLEAHPQALFAANQQDCTPLHCACSNAHLSAPVLHRLVRLHADATGVPDQRGELPLHTLLKSHKSLTPELIDVLIEAHPQALQSASDQARLPLHRACANPHMTVAAMYHLASLDTAAGGVLDSNGDLPLHLLVANHASLTPELVDAVVAAHPQALQCANNKCELPLHCACVNPHLTEPVLRHLMSLNTAAAGVRALCGQLPLHLLVKNQPLFTPELVAAVLEAFPQAAQMTNQREALPLHCASGGHMLWNAHVEAFRTLLLAFPKAAVTLCVGRLPVHIVRTSAMRARLATMLMEVTDSLFPHVPACKNSANPLVLAGQKYVSPPPDPRWASRPHPLSRQGRVKAGLHSVIRGCENVWQFQTGSTLPGREVTDKMPLAELLRAGHGSLVRERLTRSSAAVDVSGVNEAVVCALELGHVDLVRDLLTGVGPATQLVCTADNACEWLGTLMRYRHLDYSWMVEWMQEQLGGWGDVDVDGLCLEAAALSGELRLVESMAAIWQMRHDTTRTVDGKCEELAQRAVAGGNVAVLRWLQNARMTTYPTREAVPDLLVCPLAKHDRLDMMELLHQVRQWSPGPRVARIAVANGAIRVLRWLHVHCDVQFGPFDMAMAIQHGHAAVVHFLHRHRGISRVQRGGHVLAEAVRISAPDTLGVVEYVLRHKLCGNCADDNFTMRWVVSACTATTVRLDVVRYLVSLASEKVLRSVESKLARVGQRQAQEVFRSAQLQRVQQSPRVPARVQASSVELS